MFEAYIKLLEWLSFYLDYRICLTNTNDRNQYYFTFEHDIDPIRSY